MNRFFVPFLSAPLVAMVCSAAQVSPTVEAQVELLQQIPSMRTADAVAAIVDMEPSAGASPGYRESLKALKTVAVLAGCLTEEDATKKEAYLTRCRESYPGLWIMLHMASPEFAFDPEQQKQMASYMEHLSPELLKQDTRLLGARCGMMVSREGKQISPEKRKEIVLKTLSGYPMEPEAQAILAIHYLYPEYKMQDAEAAQDCLLTGALARCTHTQLNNPSDATAHSLLESLAYAAAQQQGVDTLALQFGALTLAIQLDAEKPWPRYRMGRLWADYASHPVLCGFNPEAQSLRNYEIAALARHAPSLYALGEILSDLELMEYAVAMGYDSSKDYRHVSPGTTANYNICSQVTAYLPTVEERAFAAEANDVGFHLINRIADLAEQREDVWGQMMSNLLQVLQMRDMPSVGNRADCLTATDEELLALELEGFRRLVKLLESQPYELYKLYRDGSDPTGVGKDAALAEQYLRRAVIEEAHPEALRELTKQSPPNEPVFSLSGLSGIDTKADELLICFINMKEDPLHHIVPLDDALQAWAAAYPQQSKLAEALRIHCLLFVHNKSWKTSPENNAATREVRSRLLKIIRTVPEEVIDAPTKKYLQQIFETQDASEARDLRRWYAARKITPPQDH